MAVDDEALALRRVELMLRHVPGAELVGTARSGEEAIGAVARLKPDLLLLDIRMGGIDGFELVEALIGPDMPRVVFVTAYDHFATRAFEVAAIDYLVKPVELDRLTRAIDRTHASIAAEDADSRIAELRQVVAALREQAPESVGKRYERDIWAERYGDFVPVRVEDIYWVEAERDYVRLHTAEASYLLRETISNMEARLDPDIFIRIRRSALVRRDRIAAIRRPGYRDFRVQLTNAAELRAGRTYIRQLRALIAMR